MNPAPQQPDILDQGDGIYAIDTLYYRKRMAASHLLVENGRSAFVDTGTAYSVPMLLAALERCGSSTGQVDFVFLTHIHLDHAGGAGQLIRALPNAKLVVHPRGARHMIDPARLIEGTIAVYGEPRFRSLYGELLPIDPQRVITVDDGDRMSLSGREFEFIHTPGHALHHYCMIDPASSGIFTGDSFGVSYRELDTAKGPFIIPTTTPVHFDPVAAHATIDRLLGYDPDRMFLTHFSQVSEPQKLARQLHRHLDRFVEIALGHVDDQDRQAGMVAAMTADLDHCLDEHGCTLDQLQRRHVLGADIELNCQGLDHWLSHHGETRA